MPNKNKKSEQIPKIEIVEDDNERIMSDPELLLDHLNSLLLEFGNKYNINLQEIKPLQFSAGMTYIYNHFFKQNRHLLMLKSFTYNPNNNSHIGNNIHKYNFDVVFSIYNIYKALCSLYGIVLSLDDFSNMTGIEDVTFYAWERQLMTGVTPEQAHFAKTVKSDREKSLERLLLDKSTNPIKPIAVLNHRYGWNNPSVARDRTEQLTTSNEALPDLRNWSADGAQNSLLPDFESENEQE